MGLTNKNTDLGVAINSRREQLPHVDVLDGTVCHVYIYRPYPVFGVRVAAWGRNATNMCWRFVYDTGPLCPEYSDGFHAQVDARMRSSGRARWETVAEIVGEMWPETIAQVESRLRQRGPFRSERTTVPSTDLDLLIEHGEVAHLLDGKYEEPELDCVDGHADRVIIRSEDGRKNDLVCAEWSGYSASGAGRLVRVAWQLAGYPSTS